jgi:hypothetical protein
MAITDIQISEELETNAPSIKYSGNEGPKSPQEEQMMMADAILEEEYNKYVFDLLEIRPEATPMTLEEFRQMVIAEGQMSKGPILPSPEDPVNPFQPKPQGPVLPDRQMAAYGGIMGVDGRRQYGLGSSLKKFVRKIIPNEVAEVAVKAAPFVAPFNPVVGGLMAGIGGFDQTGRIGSSLKSGLMNYGMGQLARGIGGGMDNLQGMSFRTPQGSFFSSPIQNTGGLGQILNNRKEASLQKIADRAADIKSTTSTNFDLGVEDVLSESQGIIPGKESLSERFVQAGPKGLLDSLKSFVPESTLGKIALGGGALALGTALLGGGPEETISTIMDRGEGLDIEGIRSEVLAAYKDPSGELLMALRAKYPFLGNASEKNLKAEGGRIGFAEGGGIMDLGGMEKDYRAEGGFVPIGREEKADDVPARLSVNEFVFTADAVRNAGGGDIDKGAEVMENMMKHLEQGGQVSDESQGMAGAQQMFETSERLSEVI